MLGGEKVLTNPSQLSANNDGLLVVLASPYIAGEGAPKGRIVAEILVPPKVVIVSLNVIVV